MNFAKKNHGTAKTRKVVNRCSQSQNHHALNEIDKVKRDHFVIKSMVSLLGFYVVAGREACEPINGEFELEDLGTVSRSDHPPPPFPDRNLLIILLPAEVKRTNFSSRLERVF